MPGQIYYAGGDGLYYTRKLGTPWKKVAGLPLIFKTGIRGQNINDIFIVGGFGFISHYNGFSWHTYSRQELPPDNGDYGQCAYKDDIIVAVGRRNPDAIVLIGRRSGP